MRVLQAASIVVLGALAPCVSARPAQGILADALAASDARARGGQFVVRDEHPVSSSIRLVRLGQEVGGLPVFRGEHVVALGPQDRVVAVVMGEIADEGEPGPFVVDAARAALLADAAFSASGTAGTEAAISAEDAQGFMEARVAGRDEPIRLRRVVLADGPTAAWRVELCRREDPSERACVLIDGGDGCVKDVIPLTRHVAAQGRVYPRGYLAGAEMRPFVDPDATLDPASPIGWVTADVTEGNNARVQDDRAGDLTTTPGLVATGSGDPLTFDFPVSGVPLDDLDAALTNVFWAVNDAHDRFWRLGLVEPRGAIQALNFGRGGVEGDYVRVFVQYRAGPGGTGIRNTSTAGLTSEGGIPNMTFGLWDRSGSIRDGALDTGLVYHEYTHLVIGRLVGGDPTCDDGTQPAGLSEGWADYFAASFTGDAVLGAYVSGNDQIGLRTAAIDDSAYTYGNLCATNVTQSCVATENGEIWAGTLWDVRRELLRLHGPAGAELADRLVLEGMRFTPCRPTYLEARDGILLADLALTGGADHCALWNVFLTRGLGALATTTGPDDRYPWADYSAPPECAGSASVAWDRQRYGDDAQARVLVADAGAGAASRLLRVTTSAGDVEAFTAARGPQGPGMLRSVVVPLRPGAVMPGDGVVQVGEGDGIQATCTDCAGAPSASATVSRALAVVVLAHQYSNEACHDDDSDPAIPDFSSELPSLLDAGEIATLSVTLGNAEEFPLEDVRVRVTCSNPAVLVLPQAEIAVGAVRGRYLNPAGFAVSLRAVALPSPAVRPGDRATLAFDVTARGMAGSTQLTVDLAGDYAVDRGMQAWGGVETFESSSPSASLWTHAAAGGEPADEWALRNCGRGGGRAMAYAGAGCADYPDTPSAATLVSPPLYDFGNGALAFHPTGLSWWNDVDLGVDPRTLYCESEMVQLYLTSDPNRPAYLSPRNDRFSSAQYWAQWPQFGITRNTSGFVQELPRNALTATSTVGMNLPEVRLRWVFWTDVYNPTNDGGCRITDPDAVGGGYRLDDVSFTYDRVRLVPAADTTCTGGCVARAMLTLDPPAGARCAGDAVGLSAAGSEATCAGALEYRFRGPGLDTGYTPAATAAGIAADGGAWVLNVRCVADTTCSSSMTIADPTRDDIDVGRVRRGSLRVRRDGADVVLGYDGTRSPPSYAIFRASLVREDGPARITGLTDLAGAPPPDPLRRGSSDLLEWRDAGAAGDGTGLAVYRVLGRVPCAGTALDR